MSIEMMKVCYSGDWSVGLSYKRVHRNSDHNSESGQPEIPKTGNLLILLHSWCSAIEKKESYSAAQFLQGCVLKTYNYD